MLPSLSSSASARLMTLALPLWATAACQPLGMAPTSGKVISVSHAKATVSAIKSRPRRFGELTITSASPNRLFESRKDCSIQPRCQYQEAATWASLRLVARYHGSFGCLRRGTLARLLGTLQHSATLIQRSRGRPW